MPTGSSVPGVCAAAFESIPGADTVEVRGDTVRIHSSDSDRVARYLLTTTPAHDLEIESRGIEDTFIALTSTTKASAGSTTL